MSARKIVEIQFLIHEDTEAGLLVAFEAHNLCSTFLTVESLGVEERQSHTSRCTSKAPGSKLHINRILSQGLSDAGGILIVGQWTISRPYVDLTLVNVSFKCHVGSMLASSPA